MNGVCLNVDQSFFLIFGSFCSLYIKTTKRVQKIGKKKALNKIRREKNSFRLCYEYKISGISKFSKDGIFNITYVLICWRSLT